MRKYAALVTFAVIFLIAGIMVVRGQNRGPDPVAWAYGFNTPGPAPVAPPCPPDAKPHDCSRPGKVWPTDGPLLHLPGSKQAYTIEQVQSWYHPADWYPNEHPPAPDIVKYGHEKLRLRACGHCHYFNGQGKPENGQVAGLTFHYIMEQMALFKSGQRKSADPRKANVNEMIQIARFLTPAETEAAARYYSSLKYRQWVKVVESKTAPETTHSPAGLLTPSAKGQSEPLGERIIEVPQNPDRTVRLRDPHSGFLDYVPVGSVEKGKVLVTTGGNGKTIACTVCHGPNLEGMGDVPPIAGRTASYTMRQLYNIKQGTRVSLLMKPVVQNLTVDDMISIVAYLASVPPDQSVKPQHPGGSAAAKN